MELVVQVVMLELQVHREILVALVILVLTVQLVQVVHEEMQAILVTLVALVIQERMALQAQEVLVV
jgi:hypothetical protein